MATIKKAFLEIHGLLLANEDKKVKTIMDQVTALCSAKGAGGAATSILRNDAGEVVAILDYYFKKWLPVEFVEFGSKANSASGLNTMCKLGTSLWTKQQREFKKGKEELLNQVSAGEVLPGDIQAHLDELETARGFVADYPVMAIAFESTEDLLATDVGVMAEAVATYNAEQDAIALAENEAAEAA